MCEQNRNINKEIIKKKLKRNPPKKALELKSTTEMKNSLEGLKGRFEQT